MIRQTTNWPANRKSTQYSCLGRVDGSRTPESLHCSQTEVFGTCTVQELLGHKDVKTTQICTHVLNRGPRTARSPRPLDQKEGDSPIAATLHNSHHIERLHPPIAQSPNLPISNLQSPISNLYLFTVNSSPPLLPHTSGKYIISPCTGSTRNSPGSEARTWKVYS